MTTEKRLIDANEIEELFYNQIKLGATDLMDAFDYALEDAQTVDAVPVVRCKDCKHLMFSDFYGECRKGCLRIVKPDDYCSFAERKDDD